MEQHDETKKEKCCANCESLHTEDGYTAYEPLPSEDGAPFRGFIAVAIPARSRCDWAGRFSTIRIPELSGKECDAFVWRPAND